MGINGLLPVIKPICKQKHVQELANTRVGIDAYAWLHKGVFSCASKICTGVETRAYVEYCMHRIRMLIHFEAQPVVVFDGAELPMKAGTHAERRERRKEALRKAEQAVAAGDSRKAEAWYQRACFVTSEMARNVIRECRKLNVEYVVAPYEADAQLAWMMQTEYISSVITEDSDLLVYGASRILYKMNKNGTGDMYESKNLSSLETLTMTNFTEDMFMFMCVCSGCDFFKGVQGLGIKKAHALSKRYKTLSRLLQAIRREPRYRVSRNFTVDFTRACMVFRHQTVYDMNQKVHVHLRDVNAFIISKLPHGVLHELDDGSPDLSFLGEHREPEIARKVAEGFFHPRTLKEYEEPLDIIARPILTKRRPLRFPSPPPKRRQITPGLPKSVRGFQIQPVSRKLQTSSVSTRRQMSRPLSDPLTFNPKLIGITLRAHTKTCGTTSGVWSSFRPNSRLGNIIPGPHRGEGEKREDQKCKSVVAAGDKVCASESEEFMEADEDLNETHFSLSPGTETQPETAELPGATNDVALPKRPRSSSRRVDAVNRALGKFARAKERDVREKFKPNMRNLSPSSSANPAGQSFYPLSPSTNLPSPDENTDKLFATVETNPSPSQDQASDGANDYRETPQSSVKKRETNITSSERSNLSTPSKGRPLRLSRFFKPLGQSRQPKRPTSLTALESIFKSPKAISKKTIPQTSGIVDVKAINRFNRKSAKK